MFTKEGLACVRCLVAACVDTVDRIYCMRGNSCIGDPLCSPVQVMFSQSGNLP
jgi:hypothetical protein